MLDLCAMPTTPDFPAWLETELERRGIDQSELARRASSAGYKIAPNTVSRILNRERDAGVEACIAIAAGLGISREEVFRERGWLLRAPEQVITPDLDPRSVKVLRDLQSLSGQLLDRALAAVAALLDSYRELQGMMGQSPAPRPETDRQVLALAAEAELNRLKTTQERMAYLRGLRFGDVEIFNSVSGETRAILPDEAPTVPGDVQRDAG